jgi:hypothetical protein
MKQFCLGVIVALGLTLPAFGWEAVNPPDGIYQLNYAKSTIHGPIPKSQSFNLVGDKATLIGFAPNGNPITVILPHIIDGKPHPVTGAGAFDAEAETQLDPYTTSLSRTKEGKLVQTGYIMFNPQTNTMTLSLNAANGPNSYVLVFEKQ